MTNSIKRLRLHLLVGSDLSVTKTSKLTSNYVRAPYALHGALPVVEGAAMENISESFAKEFEELERRISDAKTSEELLEALDDMAVHLEARLEIGAMLEVLAVHDAELSDSA